jgi:ATP-dependent exoDNAse (exonuclease V) alpha subunit
MQVLSPMKKGPAGTRSLNTALQALLNPPAPDKQQVQRRGAESTAVFRVGDRVIQVSLTVERLKVKDLSKDDRRMSHCSHGLELQRLA